MGDRCWQASSRIIGDCGMTHIDFGNLRCPYWKKKLGEGRREEEAGAGERATEGQWRKVGKKEGRWKKRKIKSRERC